MKYIIRLVRWLIDMRLRVFGLAIIQNVETKLFNKIMEESIESGWKKSYMYNGIDAWIDYGKLVVKRKGKKIKFEWDNWDEGVIVGPLSEIENIAKKHELQATRKVKW